jgi:carboxyvinyl-carboxyphosphonate phosphorylmutase
LAREAIEESCKMSATERRERFRAILAGETCIYPGSVYDPMSARIAEDLGFEVGMFAGSVASLTVLGAPDIILLTLSEFADQARRICRAGNLPLLVDADHGYGNALNVMRTVEELEHAGIAALTIEDTQLPPPFAETGKPSMISIEEGVGKMRAAIEARRDTSLVIAGRTSAAAIAGIDEAIARCRAYEKAGVDAVFATGITRREDLEALCAAVRIPVMLGAVAKAIDDRDYLGRTGVRIALQGHLPIMAAIRATYETLKALREGAPPATIEGIAPEALMKTVTRDELYRHWTNEFLGGA